MRLHSSRPLDHNESQPLSHRVAASIAFHPRPPPAGRGRCSSSRTRAARAACPTRTCSWPTSPTRARRRCRRALVPARACQCQSDTTAARAPQLGLSSAIAYPGARAELGALPVPCRWVSFRRTSSTWTWVAASRRSRRLPSRCPSSSRAPCGGASDTQLERLRGSQCGVFNAQIQYVRIRYVRFIY